MPVCNFSPTCSTLFSINIFSTSHFLWLLLSDHSVFNHIDWVIYMYTKSFVHHFILFQFQLPFACSNTFIFGNKFNESNEIHFNSFCFVNFFQNFFTVFLISANRCLCASVVGDFLYKCLSSSVSGNDPNPGINMLQFFSKIN